MFGEAGWEILLVLYIHDGICRLCVRQLSRLVDIAPTTILRWLGELESRHYVSSCRNHLDRRLVLLELTDFGREQLTSYLEGATV